MTAVTDRPITIAVTTRADGIGSIARRAASALLNAESMIGAVPPVIYPVATITICNPVSITAKPMMMRRMLRWVSIPHRPINDRQKPVIRRMVETGRPVVMRRSPSSASEPVENHTQLRAGLDAEQCRDQRNSTRAEKRAELPARQKARGEKAARQHESENADEYIDHAG